MAAPTNNVQKLYKTLAKGANRDPAKDRCPRLHKLVARWNRSIRERRGAINRPSTAE